MELFIRIKDGLPFEHPIFGDNFRDAFPDVDVNNLPPEFARFERVEPPVADVYEIYEGVEYVKVGDKYTDKHKTRKMKAAEKKAKQKQTKENWAVNGFKSWVFDEASCSFRPPVPYPTNDKPYRWDEPSVSWVEVEIEKVA
jgi:hypothetical protein